VAPSGGGRPTRSRSVELARTAAGVDERAELVATATLATADGDVDDGGEVCECEVAPIAEALDRVVGDGFGT
jgi:hypothetical protein